MLMTEETSLFTLGSEDRGEGRRRCWRKGAWVGRRGWSKGRVEGVTKTVTYTWRETRCLAKSKSGIT